MDLGDPEDLQGLEFIKLLLQLLQPDLLPFVFFILSLLQGLQHLVGLFQQSLHGFTAVSFIGAFLGYLFFLGGFLFLHHLCRRLHVFPLPGFSALFRTSLFVGFSGSVTRWCVVLRRAAIPASLLVVKVVGPSATLSLATSFCRDEELAGGSLTFP